MIFKKYVYVMIYLPLESFNLLTFKLLHNTFYYCVRAFIIIIILRKENHRKLS